MARGDTDKGWKKTRGSHVMLMSTAVPACQLDCRSATDYPGALTDLHMSLCMDNKFSLCTLNDMSLARLIGAGRSLNSSAGSEL